MNPDQGSSLERIEQGSKPTNSSTSASMKTFSIQSNTRENMPFKTGMRSVDQEKPIQNRIRSMIKPKNLLNSKSNHPKLDDDLQEKTIFNDAYPDGFSGSIECIFLGKEDSSEERSDHTQRSAKEIINHHTSIGLTLDTANNKINNSERLICSVLNCQASFNQNRYIQRHDKLHSDLNKSPEFNCQCGKVFNKSEELIKHCIRGICYGSTMIPFR